MPSDTELSVPALSDEDVHVLEELERETPVLSRLRRLGEGFDNARWFAHLGEAPTPRVREAAELFCSGLGFPDAELSIAPNWEDAAAAAETYDWASPAWETEELLRADLTGAALEVLSEEALSIGLRLVAQHVGEAAKEAMEEQASYWDIVDEDMKALAVGAAAQAANGASLLLVAASTREDLDVPTHPMAVKLNLFELGRWPVSLLGASFNVF